jgi:hypothetical protein
MKSLSLRQRARDISRIYLPSDLLRVFIEMYFAPEPPPREFLRWERFCRILYAWHSCTRKYRHPVRSWRNREVERNAEKYPSEKDMWIWDPKSAQAISVMRPKDRARYYSVRQHLGITLASVRGLVPVAAEYRKLIKQCYGASVEMHGRIGIAVGTDATNMDRELGLLDQLGSVPVLIRFYSHENERKWSRGAEIVDRLVGCGHKVVVSLVQDRASVLDPEKWRMFVGYVLERAGKRAELVEVGHAINRVKWGIWDFGEHRRLIETAGQEAVRHGAVNFMGPAVIDFEYPHLMAVLRNLPPGFRFSALSHHLYVDRRGSPESRQGPFATLEKCALLKAVARVSGVCGDRVIISETNWPLAGTGVYSPVTSPYESPGKRFNDPSVSESEYADYMIRYLLTALCSGMVERVYWWRLVARGFGLVDDTDPDNWRKRPAFCALKYFLSVVGDAVFTGKLPADEGIHMFLFDRKDGRRLCICYSSAGSRHVALPFKAEVATDLAGVPFELSWRENGDQSAVTLSGSPAYMFLANSGR